MLNLIVCFIISALMGMGVGGGGLFVIYLTLCLNYPQILAQGTNLIFFILSVLFSLIIHLKRRKINFKQVLVIISLGSLGCIIFSRLANRINPSVPRVILGIVLIISGIITFYSVIKNKI